MKILILDAAKRYASLVDELGVEIEVTAEVQDAKDYRYSLYNPGEKTFNWIRQQTTDTNWDVIVLGNNIQAGIKKANRIPKHLISKTIVVFHVYNERETDIYRDLGFTNFTTRDHVAQAIKTILEG